MKFCRPTYRGIFSQDPELAKKTFLEHKDFYVSVYRSLFETGTDEQHPIARKMIAADFGLKE